jgi:hypothetical protein
MKLFFSFLNQAPPHFWKCLKYYFIFYDNCFNLTISGDSISPLWCFLLPACPPYGLNCCLMISMIWGLLVDWLPSGPMIQAGQDGGSQVSASVTIGRPGLLLSTDQFYSKPYLLCQGQYCGFDIICLISSS